MWIVVSYKPYEGGFEAEVVANMQTGESFIWDGHEGMYEPLGNVFESQLKGKK